MSYPKTNIRVMLITYLHLSETNIFYTQDIRY